MVLKNFDGALNKNRTVEMEEIKRSPALRRWVYDRDGGICAGCGCDTEFTRRVFRHTHSHLRDFAGWRARPQWQHLVAMAGFDAKRATWWEADHIQPLSEGGTDTLGNLRTLCLPCHRKETARLRGRLAKTERLRRKRPRRKYQRYQLYRLSE